MRKALATIALGLAFIAANVGSALAQHRGDWDDHDGYNNRGYDHDGYQRGYGYGYDFHRGFEAAREFGFQDGARVAREDMWRGKPFNPNPRGPYAFADRGYRRDFGNINEYREHYSEAYRQAYVNTRGDYRGYRDYR